ncbi:uncharacterized protein CXorf49 homolog [Psammomys obesus]|uniref:uncharacterized protein CXorf49 homolog n=1 Tax=Psammomys obesus TaxID=48139 RepID=UPI0024533A3F|nr:uncharacterized protein CXorf49 homolog [Psammomys obesus]
MATGAEVHCICKKEIEEVVLDPEDGEAPAIRLDGLCSLRDLNLDPDMSSSPNSLSENEVETEHNSEFGSRSKLQVLESGVVVYQDHGEQSVASAIDKGDVVDCLPLVSDKVDKKVRQPADQVSRDARSYLPSKSCTTQQPPMSAEADSSRRGRPSKRLVDVKQGSVAPVQHRRAKGARACRTKKKKKCVKSKKVVPEEIQDPLPDSDSSTDECSEVQVMRVTICFKNGEQIVSGNAMNPAVRTRKRNVQPRDSFHNTASSQQVSAPRSHTLGMSKLGASCSNRKAAVFRGKEQSRSRYPRAVAGGLWKANPKKKSTQEKKPLQDTPKVIGRRPGILWGQRPKAAPVETATIPTVMCASTLESSKKHFTTPVEATEPTDATPRKKTVVKNTRKTLPAARADRGLVRKHIMKNFSVVTPTPGSYKLKETLHAQPLLNLYSVRIFVCEVPTHRAEQPCKLVDHAEMNSGDANTGAPHFPESSFLLSWSQRDFNPWGPSRLDLKPGCCILCFLSGDEDLSVVPPFPVGDKQNQAPGLLGCRQCPLLEKEAHRLRKQLADMWALNKRFQAL